MTKPFLKWAGGKATLAPQIIKLLPPHIATYYEPFVGGGAVFWALSVSVLGGQRARYYNSVLSDVNRELVDTYRAVRNQPTALMRELTGMATDEETYLEVRASKPTTLVARAARTIYLNKTGFNGLYRVNQRGEFNVPWGKRKNPGLYVHDNIVECSKRLAHTTLRSDDFAAVLYSAREGDAVYLDPPYVPVSVTSNFTSYTAAKFGPADQERVARVFRELVERGVHVVASNADCKEVRRLYRGFKMHKVSVRRNINSKGNARGPVGELLIVGAPSRRKK